MASDKSRFEELYFNVRKKEKRIYSDEEVLLLPLVNKDHPHSKEWLIRNRSFRNLREHLKEKNKPLQILDLGCGNGWMSNQISEINNSFVTGLDLHSFEIAQAKKIFQHNKRLTFLAGDLFEDTFFQQEQFDIIVLAASIQYFPDLKQLIKRLNGLLNAEGEIHIIDSHFYSQNKLLKAKEASMHYYRGLNCSEMVHFYHHHLWSDLSEFNFKILNRSWIDRFFLKTIKTKRNYFPWVVIYKLL